MIFIRWIWTLGLFSGAVIGCASYVPEPLALSHPAHPDAATLGPPVASRSLAPHPASMLLAQARQSGHDTDHGGLEGSSKTVQGEGRVIAVVPAASQLVVEHGEIKGFMDAMTMGYRAEPAKLLEGIKTGDRVRFSIDPEKKSIVKLERIP